jgi:hypothetical protein
VIFAPPGDGRIRLVHELRSNLYDSVHLDSKPRLIFWILHLGSEHVVLFHICLLGVIPCCLGRLLILVSLRFSWQAWRGSGQLVVPLFQIPGEAALASGMRCRLA